MWCHSSGGSVQEGFKFHGSRQCLLHICWVHLLHDLQRWPVQTGHELQCFFLVAPSLSLSEQLKLCLVCLPGHLPAKLNRFVLDRGSPYVPGRSSNRWWWWSLWWGDSVILGCKRIPQVCRLCPATTAADITRLRGCGAPQSRHLLPHFLHLALDDFSASLILLSHCYQFLLELFCQVPHNFLPCSTMDCLASQIAASISSLIRSIRITTALVSCFMSLAILSTRTSTALVSCLLSLISCTILSIHKPIALIVSCAILATKFSSLFQSGSLPLMSESAIVQAYLATSLAKLYPTADTNCYNRRPSSRDTTPKVLTHSFHSRDRNSLTLSGRPGQHSGRGGTGIKLAKVRD
ncbi:hypothetical protein E2C01_021397 [Portunus trituberculatus]|uniref:Uncharacterized protein n=1 Tax=Portunus trituberculatus TaxID=210409 RepID=A0A5B7E2E8_PORTR|nr:hypothetical protein [Portunus trituberculatus]